LARRVLVAIAEKLSSVSEVYTQREQDRLGQIVAAIVKRADFDGASFNAWLERLGEEDRAVWSKMPAKPAAVAKFQNHTYSNPKLRPRVAPANDMMIYISKECWLCEGNPLFPNLT
jgi:hypothetical protein